MVATKSCSTLKTLSSPSPSPTLIFSQKHTNFRPHLREPSEQLLPSHDYLIVIGQVTHPPTARNTKLAQPFIQSLVSLHVCFHYQLDQLDIKILYKL